MKHHDCPKCGKPCPCYGMSGNPQSERYFLCDVCNLAWYWINRKGKVMFTDDKVDYKDDLLYVHTKDPHGGFILTKFFEEKVEFT